MIVNYPVLFLKERDSESYTIIFPHLDGCISCGDSISDALKMARDGMGAYLFEYYIKPDEMPKSSNIDDIEIKLDDDDKEYISYKGSFKSYVSLDLTDYVKF